MVPPFEKRGPGGIPDGYPAEKSPLNPFFPKGEVIFFLAGDEALERFMTVYPEITLT